MLRPASTRRLANLRCLVGALGACAISRAGAAALLGCSMTAARNYLTELLDAGVALPQPAGQDRVGGKCTMYQLNADAPALHAFLATLERCADDERSAAAPQAILRTWRDADSAGQAPARRDPLVAALFGAP